MTRNPGPSCTTCWYGRPDEQQSAVNQLANLLLNGTPADTAVTQVFGSLERLHAAYMRYTEQRVYQYAIMRLDEKLSPTTFAARPLGAADAAARRAALHVVLDRAADARSLIAEARKAEPASPASYEAEALLLDKENKPAETLAALSKAAELGSKSGYHHFRRATLLWTDNAGEEALAAAAAALRQAIQADPNHARAHAVLSEILVRGPEPKEAVDLAARATVPAAAGNVCAGGAGVGALSDGTAGRRPRAGAHRADAGALGSGAQRSEGTARRARPVTSDARFTIAPLRRTLSAVRCHEPRRPGDTESISFAVSVSPCLRGSWQ